MSTPLEHVSNWVNGAYTSPSPTAAALITVINPATEAPIATVDATPQATVHEIVTSSLSTFHNGPWSKADGSERFAVLAKAATLLRARIPEFAALETTQTGRPIREMRAQLARIPEWLEYFAALARVHEGRVPPFKGPVVNTLTRLPLGVVAQVTPWNHPLLIAVKKLAPALAAGNVVVLKASELAPLSVLRLGPLFAEAGLPAGTLQIVSGEGRATGRFLCEDPRLAKIDLTGGLATYKAIAATAAQNLIPITAELGGKAPVCVFPSVAPARAVQAALLAAFIASGQTCVTGSRLLVHEDIYDEFAALLEQRVRALRIGDPTDPRTQIGAVISPAAVERCSAFVAAAVQDGGMLLCGGQPTHVSGKGFFFQPTIIATHATSALATQEVFGPVIALLRCTSESEIIRIANSTAFALGASVWTDDATQAQRVAAAIDAGMCG